MKYRRELPNSIVVRSQEGGDAPQLEKLQELVFPTLASDQRMKSEHYLHHLSLFPEGQFVAVDGDTVVGMTTTLRLSDSYLSKPHTFNDIIAGGWYTTHESTGEWLYGADIGTHPNYRGRGIARALYIARHFRVRELGLLGQYTMGMLSGYGARKAEMSAEEYYALLIGGKLNDPTISAQMKIGFEPHGLVANYLDDPVCDNYCVKLILPREREIIDIPSLYR